MSGRRTGDSCFPLMLRWRSQEMLNTGAYLRKITANSKINKISLKAPSERSRICKRGSWPAAAEGNKRPKIRGFMPHLILPREHPPSWRLTTMQGWKGFLIGDRKKISDISAWVHTHRTMNIKTHSAWPPVPWGKHGSMWFLPVNSQKDGDLARTRRKRSWTPLPGT